MCIRDRDYGEERWAKRIAEFIDQERREKTIETTGQLVEIIKKAIPKGARKDGPHPAKRTFQALRIAVNKELEIIEKSLENGVEVLKAGGVLAVITFHSLEDRLVKQTFRKLAQKCICPPTLPKCVCGERPKVKTVSYTHLGLLGSKYFCSNPTVPLQEIKAVVNFDSIGNLSDNKELLAWQAKENETSKRIIDILEKDGWTIKWEEANANTSDQASFNNKGVAGFTLLSPKWLNRNHTIKDEARRIEIEPLVDLVETFKKALLTIGR